MQEKMVVNYCVVNWVFQNLEGVVCVVECLVEKIVNCQDVGNDSLVQFSILLWVCDDGFDLVIWVESYCNQMCFVVNVCQIDSCVMGELLFDMGCLLEDVMLIYQIIGFVIDDVDVSLLLVVIDIVFKF